MSVSKSRCMFAVLAVAGMSIAGCGSSTEPATIPMSQADVTLLLSELDTAFAGAVSFTLMAPTAPGESPHFIRVPVSGGVASASLPKVSLSTFSETDPCNYGGNVVVAGSDNGASPTDHFDITTSFSACKLPDFTVGGSLEFKADITSSSTSATISLSVNGTLTINTNDGRSGSCPINFTASGYISEGSQSDVTTSGSVCGVPASGTFSG